MTESSRKKLLLSMLGVLLVILGWQQFPESRSTRGGAELDSVQSSRPRKGRNVRRSRRPPQPKEVRELLLSALDPEPRQYKIGRNLWAFYTPPVAPPPAAPPRRRPRPITQAPPPEPPPPVIGTGKQLPVIQFKYLGSFGPKNRRIAVLSEGEELVNALEGDVVMENFRVAKIGFESVYIEYVDFPDTEAAQLKVGG